jgi:streptogramin lyase
VTVTKTRFFAATLLVQAAILFSSGLGRAQTSQSAALAGRVSSQEEGSMEGVLVSARRDGSTFTVTVASDRQGRYSFSRNRLELGRYTLRIRAVGYDLGDPGSVEVTAQKTTSLDLKLRKTQDLAAQLSNAEWLMSVPGTDQQKQLLQCSLGCHSVERIVRSHHNTAEWMKVMQRMRNYHPSSIPEAPQVLPSVSEATSREGFAEDGTLGSASSRVSTARAEYLSTINLSSVSQWQYPLKTLPRPRGKATQVIITQYDLPRRHTVPHDITVDSEGMVWYCDMREQYLGRLDPKTAQVVEYPVPVLRPGAPPGCETVEFDRQGNAWVSMDDQGGIGKFDRKTEKFQTWSVPQPKNVSNVPKDVITRVTTVQAQNLDVDGKVWAQIPLGPSNRIIKWVIQRLDARSGEWEDPIDVYRDLPQNSPAANRPQSIYHAFADPQNNLYFTDHDAEFFGRVDAKTRKVTFYRTPTFNSGPRRGHFDEQGRFWFGEDRAGRIAMFDPKTERIQEWAIPTPFAGAYDVILDKNGYAWTGSMQTDRITRLNNKTDEMVEYLLPRFTNIRKVQIDNSTDPVAFWVADSNHDGAATVTKLEALE